MSRTIFLELGMLAVLLTAIVAVCVVNQLTAGTALLASAVMVGAYLFIRFGQTDTVKDKHIGFN